MTGRKNTPLWETDDCKKLLYWCFYALFVALFAAVFLTVPAMCDDYWYATDYTEAGMQADGSFSIIKGILGCMHTHIMTDNGRLANLTATIMLPLPHWIPMALMALVFAAGTLYIARHFSAPAPQLLSLMVLGFLITFGLTWNEMMFTLIFASNYVWALLLIPWYAFNFVSGKPGRWKAFAIGALAACWHEGYAFPLLAGSIAVGLTNRKYLTSSRIWLMAGLLVGIAWWLAIPGNHARMGEASLSRYNLTAFPFLWIEYVYLLIWAILLIRRSTRGIALQPLNVFSVAAIIIMQPFVLVTGLPRSAWAASMVAICALVNMSAHVRFMSCLTRSFAKGLCLLAGIFTLVHLGYVAKNTFELRRMWNRATSEALSGRLPENQRWEFAVIKYPYQASLLSLMRPFENVFDPEGNGMYNLRYTLKRKHYFAFVPEELRHFDTTNAIPVDPEFGTYLYGDHYVSTSPGAEYVVFAHLDMPLYSRYFSVITVPFVTDSGMQCYYHYIRRDSLSEFFGQPTSAKFYTSGTNDLWFLK